jgi:hypothetical protein
VDILVYSRKVLATLQDHSFFSHILS